MLKLFDLSLKLSGYPLDKAKQVYENILAIPEKDYPEYVERKKQEIVEFHFKNNSFYRGLTGDKLPDRWEDLPVLTKRDLQRPLKERLSAGYTEKNVFINRTSGSTGTPMIFAKDKFCHAMIWINNIHLFKQYDIDFNSSYQARFYGIPLSKIKAIKEHIKDFLLKRYRFSVYDTSDSEMMKILKIFKRRKFDYINGYTTSIVAFGHFLKKKKIILKNICPSLKTCIVTAEMLFKQDRKMLESVLGIPVVNEYGASELGIIAFQNKKNLWKLNTRDLFVEIVDKNNKPLPYNEEGRVVITSLYNKAHPFIRYDIGDIGSINLEQGIFVLKHLIGRSDDIVILPSGKEILGWTFSYITKNLIEETGSIKEFKAIQKTTTDFRIEYVADIELNENQIKDINKGIETFLESGLIFQFVKKEKLKRSPSGKLKQFESLIKE